MAVLGKTLSAKIDNRPDLTPKQFVKPYYIPPIQWWVFYLTVGVSTQQAHQRGEMVFRPGLTVHVIPQQLPHLLMWEEIELYDPDSGIITVELLSENTISRVESLRWGFEERQTIKNIF